VREYTLGIQKCFSLRDLDLRQAERRRKRSLTLRGNCLDLGDDLRLHQLAEVDGVEAEETSVDDVVLEDEAAQVEAAQNTEVGKGDEIVDLLEQKNGVEVEEAVLVVVEAKESIKLAEPKVLLESELLQDAELVEAAVELEDVVQLAVAEAAEVGTSAEEVAEAALLNLLLGGGRSDQGGEGRDDDGRGLHFEGC